MRDQGYNLGKTLELDWFRCCYMVLEAGQASGS